MLAISATDVRRLCGSTKGWCDVWGEKRGVKMKEDLAGVLQVQLGLHLEPFIATWVQRLHPIRLFNAYNGLGEQEIFFEQDRYRARPDAWAIDDPAKLGGHIDQFVDAAAWDAFFEAKSTGMPADHALRHYAPQIAVTMHVTGLPQAYLGVLYGAERLTVYKVGADAAYWQALEAEVDAFELDLELTEPTPPDRPFVQRHNLAWHTLRRRNEARREATVDGDP